MFLGAIFKISWDIHSQKEDRIDVLLYDTMKDLSTFSSIFYL